VLEDGCLELRDGGLAVGLELNGLALAVESSLGGVMVGTTELEGSRGREGLG
jgi:hypothetical protein